MSHPSRPARRSSPSAALVGCAATVLLGGCGWLGGGAGADAPAAPRTDSLRTEVATDRNERLRLLAGEAAAVERTGPTGSGADPSYRIGPDDLLDVQVFGVDELSGQARVSSGGTVSLPLLGPTPAEGRTPSELAAAVEERLRSTYMKDPRVSVEVVEMRSHSVSVVGAVNAPGAYQISGSRSLLQVLALAGGLSEEAGERVMVVRAGKETDEGPAAATAAGSETAPDGSATTAGDAGPGAASATGSDAAPASAERGIVEVDLRALLESGDSRHDVEVLPGDVVQVRPAGMIYVVGDVNRPGGFSLRQSEPLSVLKALALAEGLLPTAEADAAMVLRPSGDGRQEIPVDLERVLAGEQADPVLREQDILFVPNSATKSIARGVLDAVVRMATLRGLLY